MHEADCIHHQAFLSAFLQWSLRWVHAASRKLASRPVVVRLISPSMVRPSAER